MTEFKVIDCKSECPYGYTSPRIGSDGVAEICFDCVVDEFCKLKADNDEIIFAVWFNWVMEEFGHNCPGNIRLPDFESAGKCDGWKSELCDPCWDEAFKNEN